MIYGPSFTTLLCPTPSWTKMLCLSQVSPLSQITCCVNDRKKNVIRIHQHNPFIVEKDEWCGLLENYIIKMIFWGINLSMIYFDIWWVYVKSCFYSNIYMLKMMLGWMWNWYSMSTQWIRKLKKILVPHLVIDKFSPMDLYTFGCPTGMNADSIKPSSC